MTKSLTFVLAALMLAIAGCAGDPPQRTAGDAVAAPSNSGAAFSPLMVPIRFIE